MKRILSVAALMLLIIMTAFLVVGCDVIDETPTPTAADQPQVTLTPTDNPDVTGEKTVTVWVREGLRNATMNGDNQLALGVDNSVLILTGHPLWVEFDYTDAYGREQQTRIDLDDYYDYFILRENGGWTQLKYQDAYDNEKNAP
jgi:hypothetical protein